MPQQLTGDSISEAALKLALSLLWDIRSTVHSLSRKVDILMSVTNTLDTELSTLHDQVAANGDVVQSAVTLLNGFGAKLQALQQQLIDQGVQPGQLAALAEFTTQFQQQKDALASAVAANTVAAAPAPAPAPAPASTGAISGGSATLGTTNVANPDVAV